MTRTGWFKECESQTCIAVAVCFFSFFFLNQSFLVSFRHYEKKKKRQFLYRIVPCGELYTLNTRPKHYTKLYIFPGTLWSGRREACGSLYTADTHRNTSSWVAREGLCMRGPARGGEMETWRATSTAFYARLYSQPGGFWKTSWSNSCFCKPPDSG